jgi:hypothetical protein
MPHKRWKHICPSTKSAVRLGARKCTSCGQEGEYDGWGYSRIEAMGAYQRFYGLKPIGPHRPMADELLSPLIKLCEKCQGEGLLSAESAEDYHICATCNGTGRLLACSQETWNAARRQLLQAFPDEAVD